ncbi:MAG: N-acetylmuramoyl-L-alanine amidase [Muribaculaceae bacterium]|nr:N-acetylmuramoyl-L-alanine amidase [Muribaculaceae bacterium]
MRKINEIIVHCTATPAGREVTAAEVDRWHRARGFERIGYHFLVGLDGTVETGRPVEVAGAHCKGRNMTSIGVAYAGGLDAQGRPADTRTPEQRRALIELISALLRRFPGARVHSHRDFAAKACPCFDATTEYSRL